MTDYARDLVVIAGVPFDNLDMDETLALAEEFIRDRRPRLIATANVNFVVKAQDDPEFRDIVRRADVVTADGMPILWAARLLGHPLKARVTGSDMTPALLELAARRDYSVFFLGGGQGVGQIVLDRLALQYPNLRAFAYSPQFTPLLEMAHEDVLAAVRARKPDMLFVSLGAGKAEKWVNMHLAELNVPVCIGVGATIDFLAGRVRRAPPWMGKIGLEWLFRLLQEPRRLFGRYVGDAVGFARAFVPQWLHARRIRRAPSEPAAARSFAAAGQTVVALTGRLDASNRDQLVRLGMPPLERGEPVVLDMAGVQFLDSAGLGALVVLGKKALERDAALVAARPSAAVLESLRLARLGDFLPVLPTLEAALAAVAKPQPSGLAAVALAGNSLRVALAGRLDARSAPTLREALATRLAEAEGAEELLLDLSDVTFLDSSGINVFIIVQKQLSQSGRSLRVVAVSPPVRQTLVAARIDKYLRLAAKEPTHA